MVFAMLVAAIIWTDGRGREPAGILAEQIDGPPALRGAIARGLVITAPIATVPMPVAIDAVKTTRNKIV
jgi:hypothetical protein